MSHELTVIIPVYNRAHLVERTLDSIAASTRLPHELILVDNNSRDDSYRVCRDWAARHATPEFRVTLMQALAPGASVARDVGLAACHTDYVYFFDSDDLFSATFIADLCEAMADDADQDVFFVPVRQCVNGQAAVRSYSATADPWLHILNSQFDTLSMVFRTTFIRSIGGWNEALTVWDDWELGLRVTLSARRWRWLTRQAYHEVLVHPESQTNTSLGATTAPSLQAMQAALDEVSDATLRADLRRSCLLALYLRARIYSGKLLHEGATSGYHAFLTFSRQPSLSPSSVWRTVGWLLSTYSRWGGRGAWRIAAWCIRIKLKEKN